MGITLKAIREKAYASSYTRGNVLEKEQKVRCIQKEETPYAPCVHVSAKVHGRNQNIYDTEITYDELDDEIIEYRCTCKAYQTYDGMCKHCVALALAYRKMTLVEEEEDKEQIRMKVEQVDVFSSSGRPKEVETAPVLSKLIYRYSMREKARYFQLDMNGIIELQPTLHRDYKGWSVDFKIGAEHKYILKDIRALLEDVKEKRKTDYGKKLGFIHDWSAFTEKSQEILHFMEQCLREKDYAQEQEHSFVYLRQRTPVRHLGLSEDALVRFLQLLLGEKCKVEDNYTSVSELIILDGDPMIDVKIAERQGGYQLTLPKLETFSGKTGMAVRMGSLVYLCSEQFKEEMQDICGVMSRVQETVFDIQENDMNSFCSTIYPILERRTYVKKEANLERFMPQDVEIRIYLDMRDQKVIGKVTGTYGEDSYNLLDTFALSDMYRDIARESAAVYVMKAYFEKSNEENEFELAQANEEKIYQLISTGIQQMRQMGEVYVSESLKALKVHKAPKLAVGVSLNGGLLDLTMEMDGISDEDLKGILSSYKMRKKYYRLKNGDFLQIEGNVMTTFSELMEGLVLDERDWKDGKLQIPKYKAFYLDQVLKDGEEGLDIARNQAFKALVRNIHFVEDSDYEVPKPLKKVLRKYQKTGYRWLCTLESMGFGGILADDMGLGKTIQVIAFFDAKRAGTSLIVSPASLVYNWESEIQKFAPQLRVLVMTGSAVQRKEKLERYKAYDVVITSYDLLKRDIEFYEKIDFYAQIIDEAQNIKNHATQIAKAVKQISAQVKFALTGTPIENRLSELWSIFDYLMPGMFGSYEYFRREYEYPIVQEKDEIVTRRLQRMIKPFVLRRLKADVLKDIPGKIENVIYSKLEGKQAELYAANVQELLDSLKKSSQENVQSEKFQILSKLTRLRQICCAPELVYEGYKEGAAKLDTCMELIENAMEGGHKILLFSQFTSMLGIIETELRKKKVESYMLTGATTKEKRKEMVERFNQDAVPVFLISLKAGGTGLNLTAATIVIHFDPWWNVAAQNQATDRAHRIGQKETVTVFKLIAKNTLEEKILQLQEEKKELSEQIVSGEGVQVSALTKEDFMGLLEND